MREIARLDCCVTVVDAANFESYFYTSESLIEKFPDEKLPELDERTVSELMIDQLEFANVIIVNKIDCVSKEKLESIVSTCKKFNPKAKII